MSSVTGILSVGVILATAMSATPSLAAEPSPQASACASSTQAQSLSGDAKKAFVQKCLQSPMAPPKSNLPKAQSQPAKAITSPSGADSTKRSAQCSTEADRRGLTDNARKEFRLSCLATAAPVAKVGASTQPPAPNPEKSNLGVVKNGRQD
jgi:hypothetical protein